MEITINLMTVLYVVLAYLAVGYVVVLGWGLYDIEKNFRSVSKEERNRRKIKQLYWSLIVSWAFPYLLWSEIPDAIRERRFKKMDGGFLRADGTPIKWRELVDDYGTTMVPNEYDANEYNIFWAHNNADKIYKYAKENYETAK